MPYLVSGDNQIDFADITADAIATWPKAGADAARLIAAWQAGEQVFTLHTSGSTGAPKRIELYRDKIEFSTRQTAAAFGLEPGDTLHCCLGPDYIAGFMMVMRALVLGCHLLVEDPAGNPLKNIPENRKIDFAAFVPLQLDNMLSDAHAVKKLNRMKAILAGGAALSPPLEQQLQKLSVPVYHTYSMTETYTHVAFRRLNGPEKSPYYRPMPGTSFSLDERGCLVIQSYITDLQPLVTNDLAILNNDGTFALTGRADNIINSGGVKISLEHIEKICALIFAETGERASFFAAGLPDEKLGQKLALVIEGLPWTREKQDHYRSLLTARLGKYEVPKDFLFTDKIIQTRTGKTDRINTLKKMDL